MYSVSGCQCIPMKALLLVIAVKVLGLFLTSHVWALGLIDSESNVSLNIYI